MAGDLFCWQCDACRMMCIWPDGTEVGDIRCPLKLARQMNWHKAWKKKALEAAHPWYYAPRTEAAEPLRQLNKK